MKLVFDKGIQAIDFLMGVSPYGEALFLITLGGLKPMNANCIFTLQ